MGNWNTPIYSALKAYSATGPLPFHMPGHKLGSGIPEEFLTEIEKLDLTEIPGLDNLHAPDGVVKEAQELAAKAFGAKESFFLVNGSTVGLHAAIAAVCKPGSRLIAGRDSHSSVINGMLISGVHPYYILPEYSEYFGIHTGFAPQAIEKAVINAPDAAGVLITRPNYYGVCCDIREISDIVHSYDKILIVDEAHGPHLAFSPELPVSALEAGADICIQSAHKTLPAFTQGAYLHIGSDRVDRERISFFLDIFQTTSPSYIIMAYLDIARDIMQKRGRELLDRLLGSIKAFRTGVDPEKIAILDRSLLPGFEHDTTRITANISKLGMTGYYAEKLLREKYNLQVEMSDLKNIVCIATAADTPETIERLFSAFDGLIKTSRRPDGTIGSDAAAAGGTTKLPSFKGLKLPGVAVEPSYILNSGAEKVLLENAVGRISGGIISPYPPGMALVCPGETFSPDIVAYIREIIEAGGIVHGIDEAESVSVIRRAIKEG